MKFSYEDLISGDSIFVEGIGHLRSPLLKELKPTQGIGIWNYNIYINLLIWNKNELIKFMQVSAGKRLKALTAYKELNAFDILTVIEQFRNTLLDAISFFIEEELEWDKNRHSIISKSKVTHEKIGLINRDNFDEVRDMMLQMNYISLGKTTKPTKYSSAKSQNLWEKAQARLNEDAKNSSPDKRMALGNIISKLCVASAGYNLLNVYDLTIFQLYDQFFQYGFMRAMDLNEMAYSNHGGKEFDIQAWLKPITNFEKEQK